LAGAFVVAVISVVSLAYSFIINERSRNFRTRGVHNIDLDTAVDVMRGAFFIMVLPVLAVIIAIYFWRTRFHLRMRSSGPVDGPNKKVRHEWDG